MDSIAQARLLLQSGRLRDAGDLLSQMLRAKPADADAMQLLAAVQFRSGYQREGLKLAKAAVGLEPGNAGAWMTLGFMHENLGAIEEAIDAFEEAIVAAPQRLDLYTTRADILQRSGRHQEAAEDYRRAIELGLNDADAYFAAGNSLAATGQFHDAAASYRKATELNPGFSDAWNNLGIAHLGAGDSATAAEALAKAAEFPKTREFALANLAATFQRLGRRAEAIATLDSLEKEFPENKAIRSLRAEIDVSSALESSEDMARRARALVDQGYWREAVASLEGVEDPALRLLDAMLIPAVFESADTPLQAIEHIQNQLAKLRDEAFSIWDPSAEIGISPFHLAYLGTKDRPILEGYSRVLKRACPALDTMPSYTPGINDRIRVGVCTAMFHRQTVYFVFGGLVERLDPEQFEVVFLQIGPRDEFTDRVIARADKHVVLPTQLGAAQEAILLEELDILFYPDSFMNPLCYYLGLSRLAPVQVSTWGHPSTTGSPEMDYFLSSTLLEPPDAQAQYTEKLWQTPHLNMFFDPPSGFESASRSELGLPEDKRLYGCLQAAYKFHPDFDGVLERILRNDEQGVLVVPEPDKPGFKDILLERWRASHPLLLERTLWFPQVKLERFLAISRACDALLAPIQFGGGRTSFDAFSVGAPVATMEGDALKTRITAAAYRQMGVEGLVAQSEDEYVDLALRLANDLDWQHAMRSEVANKSIAIYRTESAVAETNAFFAAIAPK